MAEVPDGSAAPAAPGPTAPGARAGPAAYKPFRRIVWPFAIAETLVWACYYYSFPALLQEWEADLGFSKTTLTGAFTLSLIVAAVLAPMAGRQIDHGRGRIVFAGGAVLAASCLLLLSQVTEIWQFYAVWIGIGVGMAGSLYEPCFAILTYSMGNHARRAIILVTLAAGFAGTVSFPSAHVLTGLFGWRGTVIVFAVVVLVVCVPLILYGCHYAAHNARASAPRASSNARQAMGVMRTATFWMIGIAFTLLALDHGLIVSHMLPILADRGLGEDLAVFAASMFGPMQVAGRLAMIAAERHVSVLAICCACFISMTLAGTRRFLLDLGGDADRAVRDPPGRRGRRPQYHSANGCRRIARTQGFRRDLRHAGRRFRRRLGLRADHRILGLADWWLRPGAFADHWHSDGGAAVDRWGLAHAASLDRLGMRRAFLDKPRAYETIPNARIDGHHQHYRRPDGNQGFCPGRHNILDVLLT